MKRNGIVGLMVLGGILAAGAAPEYVLHEWGTFTSVFGSDGVMLAGLQREEESLPPFVHAHDGMKIGVGGFLFGGKGWKRPLQNVTVKMETPVIYFYSEEGFKGTVTVGFKGGSISQWYPPRQGGETPPARPVPVVLPDGNLAPVDPMAAAIDFAGGTYTGEIRWDFEVMPPGNEWDGKVFRRGETLNWLRPRQTASNVIRVGEDYEKYLFYRGVGNFEMPVKFRVDAAETLRITNTGKDPVPYALVFEMKENGKVGFHELPGGIMPGESASVPMEDLFPASPEAPVQNWFEVGPVYDKMVEGLVASGLRRDESDAMVQTWWDSYFGTPGLRVFWVVPRAETDRVLPLDITPPPAEMVRVLVGRSEVLRPEFERKLVEEFQAEKKEKWSVRSFDRFGEAYGQRVQVLIADSLAKTVQAASPGLQTP